MEKFNVKKIENAILTDCPDDAIQEVIETADIPIYGQLLLDVNNNDSFLHFSFRARDCNIVYSFDVIIPSLKKMGQKPQFPFLHRAKKENASTMLSISFLNG